MFGQGEPVGRSSGTLCRFGVARKSAPPYFLAMKADAGPLPNMTFFSAVSLKLLSFFGFVIPTHSLDNHNHLTTPEL
jgi:hypothetical protein